MRYKKTKTCLCRFLFCFRLTFRLYYINMDFILSKISKRVNQNKLLTAIYASNIFLSFHYCLMVYINSSFLSSFFKDSQVSIIYMLGSIFNIILLLTIPKVLNEIGNYKLTLYAIALEFISIAGLILTTSPFLIALYFILHVAIGPIILFNLDVFLESESPDETKTGGVRGIYLTLTNATLVLSPSIVGLILTRGTYYSVYIFSLLFVIPLFILIQKYFKNYVDQPSAHINIRETLATYLQTPNLSHIFYSHFTLQLFYAFMVIYTPIYLSQYIGFSWSEIGLMFTIMLLPFVLFELPIGKLADTKYGEKEILTLGLVIMGLSTLLISFITIKSFVLWTILLFITRTGASFVEVTSDSYFFKQVTQRQTDEISMYRITRPLSFVVAPLLATLSFQFLPYQYIFIVIGTIVIFTTRWSLALVDTR